MHQSKLSQKAYCSQQDLSFVSFDYWRTRLNRKTEMRGRFIMVNLYRSSVLVNVFLSVDHRLKIPVHALAKVLPIIYRSVQDASWYFARAMMFTSICADPMDMRKSIDGLSARVEQEMALSPRHGGVVCVLQSRSWQDQVAVLGAQWVYRLVQAFGKTAFPSISFAWDIGPHGTRIELAVGWFWSY